ncbi:hypothetical protein B9Q09_01085 [Candidatus Marsarchaeota G2 archaeon ECH_B_SAG-C16]|uniref:Uncharacterized protein n=1 Tax=Candidatus Marsarchaeota G2 archaeon ECH_B_SAG-C16 TaxID=1978163 RepID=A0A2R6BF38_9ARCH|nr:MAG: hypothetical protein B9Q09_01085 [Candidatus Marsarchaeota G2 archaeon ECH_B_SAG-C16]
MSESTVKQDSAPSAAGGGSSENRGATRLRRLLMVELLFISVELVSGVYMVVVGVNTLGVGIHGAFGVLAGLLGIVILIYAIREPWLHVGSQCTLGLVFVVVAGLGGLLYLRGVAPAEAYLGLMAVGFILSGAFYSMPLSRLSRQADHRRAK